MLVACDLIHYGCYEFCSYDAVRLGFDYLLRALCLRNNAISRWLVLLLVVILLLFPAGF